MGNSFGHDFKHFFGRGLAILLPSIVTLWLLWQAFGFVYKNVAEPINSLTRQAVVWVVPRVLPDDKLPGWFQVPEERVQAFRAQRKDEVRPTTTDAQIRHSLRRDYLRTYWSEHWYLNLTGLLIAIVLIYLAGVLVGNFFGRTLYARVERLISRIPGFKQVYPHVKQVVDLIMGDKKMAFSKAVLVEYPSPGIWTVGFLTGDSIRSIDKHAGAKVVTVFIPTSPTPFTGFTISVAREKVLDIDLPMEAALRFVITAGVLTPDADKARAAEQMRESIARIGAADATDQASDPAHGQDAAGGAEAAERAGPRPGRESA